MAQVTDLTLARGIVGYTGEEAVAAIVGYAFGTRELELPGLEPGAGPAVRSYGYATYDCVLPAPGDRFTDLDVLVVNGLNAKAGVERLVNLRDAADRAAAPLAEADRASVPFWQLGPEQVRESPPEVGIGNFLVAAWRACVDTPQIYVAITHKLLHHKRPHLIPLIDGKTRPVLRSAVRPGEGIWAVVHDDLVSQEACFDTLERRFAVEAAARGGVPLTRLRLHDILLWLDRTGRRDHAVGLGQALLASAGSGLPAADRGSATSESRPSA